MADPDGLRICTLSPDDAPRLLAFYQSLSPQSVYWYEPFHPVNEDVLRRHLEAAQAGEHFVRAVVSPSGVVEGHGFVLAVASPSPVFGIGLRERIHGLGWGRRLMGTVIGLADEAGLPLVTLTVFKDNVRARSLYGSFGFQTIRDHDARAPADSLWMERRVGTEG